MIEDPTAMKVKSEIVINKKDFKNISSEIDLNGKINELMNNIDQMIEYIIIPKENTMILKIIVEQNKKRFLLTNLIEIAKCDNEERKKILHDKIKEPLLHQVKEKKKDWKIIIQCGEIMVHYCS